MEKLGDDKYISHLSIDCVIFGYQNKELKVLIAKFKFGNGVWSLPGGYILKTEGIDKAASRILRERTGLAHIYLEQFRVFGDEDRIVNSPYRETVKSELRKFDEHRFDAAVTDWLTSRLFALATTLLSISIKFIHRWANLTSI